MLKSGLADLAEVEQLELDNSTKIQHFTVKGGEQGVGWYGGKGV